MIFDTIFYEWDEKPLDHQISASVNFTNQGYQIMNKPLGIALKGRTYIECEVLFQDELDSMYEGIGLDPDDELTEGDQKIKRTLLWHVGAGNPKPHETSIQPL